MYYLFFIIMINMGLSMVVFFVGKLFKLKHVEDMEMLSPFECGFSTKSLNLKPFSLRFFVLGIVFLIFDLELVIMYPFYMSFMKNFLLIPLVLFNLVVVMLTLGFFYEWNEMKINWLN